MDFKNTNALFSFVSEVSLVLLIADYFGWPKTVQESYVARSVPFNTYIEITAHIKTAEKQS